MARAGIISWCDRIIKFGYFLVFALVPLLLTPINYELFEYNKMIAVYAIAVIVGSAWLIKMIKRRELRVERTPWDIPIALFVVSQFISALFSIDRHVSWFGYYSRFNGGMWSILSYVVLYYAFVSNKELYPTPQSIFRLLKTSLVAAALVAIYGVLERLGIDKSIWVQDVQNRVFSTLGQPNWLAAYLVALIPLSMAFALSHLHAKSRKGLAWSIAFALLGLLFFVVLLFTKSRSGFLGFAVADIVFWCLHGVTLAKSSHGAKQNQSLALKSVLGVHVVFALLIFFIGTGTPAIDRLFTLQGLKQYASSRNSATALPPIATASGYTAPALESGGTESGTIRKYVWEGAITAWKSTKKAWLIGTGTETFAFAFYQYRPVGHNMTSEWDFLYNKAHNEYLNYLATTGALGLGSYLLLLGSFVVWFVKKAYGSWPMALGKNDSLTIDYELATVHYALFAGWLSILITNFFGFSVVITQVFLFLFPAYIFMNNKNDAYTKQLDVPHWTAWIPLLGGLFVLIRIGTFWYADTLFASGYRLNRANLIARATPLLVSAVSLNPHEPLFHDELAGSYAALAVGSAEAKNATQAATLAQLAISESDKALATSPNNVNFWKTRTKVFYTLASLDPALNTQAIDALKKALALSPNDPKIYYNLAILSGRDGEGQIAVDYLLRAKALKPNYRDVYYALNIFYTEMNKKADARAILQEYLDRVDSADSQFKELLSH